MILTKEELQMLRALVLSQLPLISKGLADPEYMSILTPEQRTRLGDSLPTLGMLASRLEEQLQNMAMKVVDVNREDSESKIARYERALNAIANEVHAWEDDEPEQADDDELDAGDDCTEQLTTMLLSIGATADEVLAGKEMGARFEGLEVKPVNGMSPVGETGDIHYTEAEPYTGPGTYEFTLVAVGTGNCLDHAWEDIREVLEQSIDDGEYTKVELLERMEFDPDLEDGEEG